MSWTPDQPPIPTARQVAVIEHEDWGTVHLVHSAHGSLDPDTPLPYYLKVADCDGLTITDYPLSLADLRQLHHRLTDEFVRLATGGRYRRGRTS